MDFSFWFDTKKLGIYPCTYLGESGYNFQKLAVLISLKIVFTITNIVDRDDMKHYAAFYLGFRCMQKYSFKCFPNIKV